MKLPWHVKEFVGSNATSYLRRFNLMTTDCGLTGTVKLNRFSAYYTISNISEVESLAGYEDGDWDTFQGSLKKYYFDSDLEQKEYQIPYLHSLWEHQRRKGAKDLKAYGTQFMKIARVLIRERKLSGYGPCAEFYGGLLEVAQEDIQRRLNIDWTDLGALDVDNIIQEVINLEDSKLGRQRFLHSTHSAPSQSASAPEPKPKTRVVPAQEIRSAPALEAKSQEINPLTALMDQMSMSMVEMDTKHAQLDILIAIVDQIHLGLSHQNGSKSWWSRRISFMRAFSAFFASFFFMFLRAFLRSHDNFYFLYTSYPFLFIFLFIFFSFIYISMLFLLFYISDSLSYFYFYLLFMPLIVLSSIWEKGHLGFVCCFSAFSTISAFFFCFLFLFYPSSVSAFSSFFLSLFS